MIVNMKLKMLTMRKRPHLPTSCHTWNSWMDTIPATVDTSLVYQVLSFWYNNHSHHHHHYTCHIYHPGYQYNQSNHLVSKSRRLMCEGITFIKIIMESLGKNQWQSLSMKFIAMYINQSKNQSLDSLGKNQCMVVIVKEAHSLSQSI